MRCRHALNGVCAVIAAMLLAGCMPKMTIEELKAMKPARPAELDKLDAFVGTWTWEGKATFAGLEEPIQTSGMSEVKWGGDGWYLVAHHTFNMDELGEMRGLETWSYDAEAGKFRTNWVDDMGSSGHGTLWHDERTNTWHMRATAYSPHGKTKGKGHISFLDENTQEWEWKEYTMLGLMKVGQFTGVSRRQ